MYLNPRYFVCAGRAFEGMAAALPAQRIAAFGMGLLPQIPAGSQFQVLSSQRKAAYVYLTTET
jgi:hypothetical protein